MKAKQAEKHGNVIKWWVDNTDRGVWFYIKEYDKWEHTLTPIWLMDTTYVQNDEYVVYRKALVEGKTLQINVNYPLGEWGDMKCETLDFRPKYYPNKYRVKPDKPRFKVGEIVRSKVDESWVKIVTEDNLLSFHGEDRLDFDVWKPIKGDYCWFYDDEGDTPRLGKFDSYFNDLFICEIMIKSLSRTYSYNHCEPFLDSLPTTIQNK